MRARRLPALIVAAAMLLTGCTTSEPTSERTGAPTSGTLRVVAGSEQQSVVETIVKPWCASRHYRCEVTFKGSVDQARLLAAGSPDYDAYWFASSVFLQLGDRASTLRDVQPMFLTPVVFAAWRSEMDKLGFAGRSDVPIADILRAVESGRTKVWITNPTQSNSGATVLFGFLNYFAGNGPGTPLTQQQLDSPAVEQGVSRFVKAMDQTPPSTGTLMTDCLAHPDQCRAMFTYEDLVIEHNAELVKAGKEPLLVAYPRGSLAVSDAPLGFLPQAGNDSAHQIFTELQNHLLKDADAQAALLKLGRRPASGVGLTLDKPDANVFNPAWGIQATINEQAIQFPAASVIQAALDRYQTRYRRPVAVHYCLDGSGSMGDNDGWTGVQAAAGQIFEPDQAALNFLQTHPQDSTTVSIFNGDITGGSPWTVQGNDAAALRDLARKVTGYRPDGGTDMYACLLRAANELARPQPDDRKRLVVLMTDGQSDTRRREPAVAALRSAGVPVVAIAFGRDADPTQLKEVAEATNGTFVRQDDLVAALRQAAGYK
ncbi:vWA domain-containing protein [Micromonospora narathiwatensis]|uniref:Ca-activated chloride channel family protein n=1 Tax=Micromonospora narathiwatensis TaxID=299146 RepID=A0A1A9AFU8_9ACTN|nr:vWA domain-containing protein [Micromonospora narathiwatensis]SBT55012.1 Ca-activated chloride channel family protein [Micromonospora narathiwatensis]